MIEVKRLATHEERAERWVRWLADAWQDDDVELADALVAEDFAYHEITGITTIDDHAQLRSYWVDEGSPQLDLELWVRRPHITDRGVVAEIWTTMFYVGDSELYLPPDPAPLQTRGGRTGRPISAVWAMIATLDDDGRATEVDQYHYLIPGGRSEPPAFWGAWYWRGRDDA